MTTRAAGCHFGSLIPLLFCIVACLVEPCAAQFNLPRPLAEKRIELPPKMAGGARARGSGFTATIDISNQFGSGYIGVSAQLTSTVGQTTTERPLVIRLTPTDRHLPSERAVATEIPITFPQGQTTVRLQQSVPKWTIGNSYRVEILEGGVPLENYASEIGASLPGYATRRPGDILVREWTSDILFVDVGLPPVSRPPIQMRLGNQFPSAWQSKSLASLPTDWRLLRDIDCIVIRDDALRSGTENRFGDDAAGQSENTSPQIRAIRHWAMMGGTLVVFSNTAPSEPGDDFGMALVQTESNSVLLEATVGRALNDERGRIASFGNYLRDLAVDADPNSVRLIDLPSGMAIDAPGTMSSAELAKANGWMKERRDAVTKAREEWESGSAYKVGMGSLIYVPEGVLESDITRSILEQLVVYRRSPILERGVDSILGDTRHRNWLIPGVAEPPVYTFMGILTLFVLFVGPIAYRWTTRGHRSHLMFLIAPALALFTTVAMFTYSIVSDGFGTTVRIRQLTWIDGSSGDAAERTRSTLFSGISPREGIRFAPGAEVMAYPAGGKTTWRDQSTDVDEVRLQVKADQSSQQFASSVLPSRSQTQFVSHLIRPGLGSIKIKNDQALDENGLIPNRKSIELFSTLPFEVRELVVRSPDGQYWTASRIGSNETVDAKLIVDPQDASKQLGELYTRFRPIGSTSRAGRSRRDGRIGDLILFLNREINPGAAVVTDGVFEQWLNETLFIKGDLPEGTFVGISAPTDDVVGVDEAEKVASVRYLMGTL